MTVYLQIGKNKIEEFKLRFRKNKKINKML